MIFDLMPSQDDDREEYENLSTFAYVGGMERAAADTARQAERFDQHFGDDSARYHRRTQAAHRGRVERGPGPG